MQVVRTGQQEEQRVYEEKHREHLEHLDGEYNQAGSRKYLRETLAITEIMQSPLLRLILSFRVTALVRA